MSSSARIEPTVHVVRSIIARAERDLENSSFLSACDCVSVASTILNLKLTGRTEESLGYDEALMLVTSTRREVRLAYLLLMDLYYSANRGAFAESLFQELYNSSTDSLERILLLNSMMAMGESQSVVQPADAASSAQIKCLSADLKQASTTQLKTQLQVFSDNLMTTILRSPTSRPPPEIFNRLLVYLANTHSLTDALFLELNFASHLPSTTCNTLCQLLRPRVRASDIDFVPLIPAILRRIIQTIETNEDCYLAIPDPWFLTNALKVLRSYFPTRYIAHESDLAQQNIPVPVNPTSTDFISRSRTSRFQRSASLLMSFTSRSYGQRRNSDPEQMSSQGIGSKPIPALLCEVLSKILQFSTNQSFTPAQYRHHRNVLSMVKAEACRLIYAIQPSDYWLDQATEETIIQFKTLNTNTIRNAIATWTVAAQDPTLVLSQSKIVTHLIQKLSQVDIQGFIKVRLARLLVQIAISDIMVNGLSTFEEDFVESENQINQADNCYDPSFVIEAASTRTAPFSPHSIVNVLLLALGKRDPKSIKIQLTQCACSLISACRTLDEETITPVISELLTLSPDVWSTLLPLIEEDKLAAKVLIMGENMIREKVWQNESTGKTGWCGGDRQYLGWLKLTLHLIGRFGICHIIDELGIIFKGWSEISDQWRGLDQEAVCLLLVTVRKMYLGCEETDQQSLKNLVNGFLCHEDISVQTAATETWLMIRAASFPTCA